MSGIVDCTFVLYDFIVINNAYIPEEDNANRIACKSCKYIK